MRFSRRKRAKFQSLRKNREIRENKDLQNEFLVLVEEFQLICNEKKTFGAILAAYSDDKTWRNTPKYAILNGAAILYSGQKFDMPKVLIYSNMLKGHKPEEKSLSRKKA